MLLPITSVEINQQRRTRGCRRKIIEYFIRPLAPGQILLAAKLPLRVAAAGDIRVDERFNRRHTAARRILPFALRDRPIPPVGWVMCHVQADSANRFRRKQYYKTAAALWNRAPIHEAGVRGVERSQSSQKKRCRKSPEKEAAPAKCTLRLERSPPATILWKDGRVLLPRCATIPKNNNTSRYPAPRAGTAW